MGPGANSSGSHSVENYQAILELADFMLGKFHDMATWLQFRSAVMLPCNAFCQESAKASLVGGSSQNVFGVAVLRRNTEDRFRPRNA